MNETAMFKSLYFHWCNLNVNEIGVVVCFYKLIWHFLSICFQVYVSKISAKTDKFFFNL